MKLEALDEEWLAEIMELIQQYDQAIIDQFSATRRLREKMEEKRDVFNMLANIGHIKSQFLEGALGDGDITWLIHCEESTKEAAHYMKKDERTLQYWMADPTKRLFYEKYGIVRITPEGTYKWNSFMYWIMGKVLNRREFTRMHKLKSRTTH